MCDVSHNETGGVSGGYRSVECQHRRSGHCDAWMLLCTGNAWMHEGGQQMQGQMLGCRSHVEWVTDMGEGVSGCREE